MGFNKQQLKAINTSVDSDVIISAGAGSGKTATLSEKVLKLVTEDHILPASLLVVTFTDKAAHEMKEKIIHKFAEKSNDESMKQQIQSSHIQTFDSLFLYLVQKYSARLGLPETVSIGSDAILDVKKEEVLDEILDEYYESRDKQFLSTLMKFDLQGDKELKYIIFDLDNKLNALIPSVREDFTKNYASKFLTDEFISVAFSQFLDSLKAEMIETMNSAIFSYRNSGRNSSEIAELLKDPRNVDCYRGQSFELDITNKLYEDILELLGLSGQAFLEKLLLMVDTKEYMDGHSFSSKFKKMGEGGEALKTCHVAMRDKVKTLLSQTSNFGSLDEQKVRIQSFKDDIQLLFEIVDKLDGRMMDYKRTISSFTFSDIQKFALRLLTEEQFADVAEEIQSRFKYILVDEYQDTNDLQELFLNEISKKSTLFCVGDAKQSIYGFRNANCQLFLDRKENYEKALDPNKVPIEMNTNYRSVPKLLSDINTIFVEYMTHSHGGIVFSDEKEQLAYDRDVNLYKLSETNGNDQYGVKILTYDEMMPEAHENEQKQEILLIIHDIINKIENKYQVLDFGKDGVIMRDCTFKDFAILLRVKANFLPYKKLFAEYGIPVNNDLEEHLGDIDAVILLQSLIALISGRMGYTSENTRHLFASVARSYIYGKSAGYTDQVIFDTLSDKNKLNDCSIMKQIDAFCKENRNNSIETIFLHLINEFGIVSKLPSVGNVAEMASKIDSFYEIVKGQQALGDGMKEFVTLFKNVSKYSVELSSSSVSLLDNAVELTTIHKSKGLEYPIVYLPNSQNHMVQGGGKKPNYIFSRNYGLLMPNYCVNEPVDTFLKPCYMDTEGSIAGEVSEHVRLFYVALTRAKETVYIVGKKKDKHESDESLFEMLDYTYHLPSLYMPYLEKKVSQGVIPTDLKNQYCDLLAKYEKAYSERPMKDDRNLASVTASLLYKDLVLKKLEQELKETVNTIREILYNHYVSQLESLSYEKTYRLFVDYSGFNDYTQEEINQALAGAFEGQSEIEMPENLLVILMENVKHSIIDEDPAVVGLIQKKNEKDETFAARVSQYYHTHYFELLKRTIDEEPMPFIQMKYPFDSIYVPSSTRIRALNLPNNSALINKDYRVDDSEIVFSDAERKRASKFSMDEENIEVKKMGIEYHRYLELADFYTKDTSYIKDEKARKIIDRVLSLDIFDLKEGDKVYPEYEYDDPEYHTYGSMDCIIVRADEVILIDYKLKHIDDEHYPLQLKTYERNLNRLFPGRKVKKYLLSILDGKYSQVE